jgi:IclR family KDG regulon transcriptional repressor
MAATNISVTKRLTAPRSNFVKSAQRVLEVLEYFDGEHPAATVGDISKAFGYPQSSTSVLLRCLRDLGYLYYNRSERTYRPTGRAAFLGCWAEDGIYRGGRMLQVVDAIAARLGETVMLSSAYSDYAVHHLHVVRGSNASAVLMRAGHSEPVLHCLQGELTLSSYPDRQISLALHRCNVDERDPARLVSIPAKLAELQEIRRRGCWAVRFERDNEAAGVVGMLMPRRKGADRVILSVVARSDLVRQRGEEYLKVMREERDRVFPEGIAPKTTQAPFPREIADAGNPLELKRKPPVQAPSQILSSRNLRTFADSSSGAGSSLNGVRALAKAR